MIAETSTPTLLEDWQQRRSQLEGETHTSSDQMAALVKVLDYLIRRYQGTDAALQPARAAAPQATIVNTRAMVVHHHLWSGVVAGAKNCTEAQERIVTVLHRMEESSRRRIEDELADKCLPRLGQDHPHPPRRRIEDELADQSDSADPFVEPGNFPCKTQNLWSSTVVWAFRLGLRKLLVIRCSLNSSPFLPECAVKYLAEGPRLTTDEHVEAIRLLARCASRSVFESAIDALADRLESTGPDDVTKALTKLLREPTVQQAYYPKTIKAARTRLRERLASEDPQERRRAISVLALLGDLRDISLLADLAAVSELDATCPEEHAALVAAMDAISRR